MHGCVKAGAVPVGAEDGTEEDTGSLFRVPKWSLAREDELLDCLSSIDSWENVFLTVQ